MKIELNISEWANVHNALDARGLFPVYFPKRLEEMEKHLCVAERRIQGALEREGVQRILGLQDARGWEFKKSSASKKMSVEITQEETASLYLFLVLINATCNDGGEYLGISEIPYKLHERLKQVGAEVVLSQKDQVAWVLQNGARISYS